MESTPTSQAQLPPSAPPADGNKTGNSPSRTDIQIIEDAAKAARALALQRRVVKLGEMADAAAPPVRPPTQDPAERERRRLAAEKLKADQDAARIVAEQKDKELRIVRSLDNAMIPPRYDRDVASYYVGNSPAALSYQQIIQRLPDKSIIALVGPSGTGKTMMACQLLRAWCYAGNSARYVKALDFFRSIRACFGGHGQSEAGLIREYRDYKMLVIDEAEKRSDTPWENMTLTNLIDHRYDDMTPTILISNCTRAKLAESLSMSVVSRMHECGLVVECDWPSFRTPQ